MAFLKDERGFSVSTTSGDGGARRRVCASAPGKLYVAGEYAVVEPGNPAIIVAVNRLLTACIAERHSTRSATGSGVEPGECSIHSDHHPQETLQWHRERRGNGLIIVPDGEGPSRSLIVSALQVVEDLAQERNIDLRDYDVRIHSELDDASGRKYGLGSSAAVTVAVIRALARLYAIALPAMQCYKLAYLASFRVQKSGSGGDLAASVWGGCIRYASPDRAWILHRIRSGARVGDLTGEPWPGLSVDRIPALTPQKSTRECGGSAPAPQLRLLVGWTGKPASTPELVRSVRRHVADGTDADYRTFLRQSSACVDDVVPALAGGDMAFLRPCIARARGLLNGLSSMTDTPIETHLLHELVETATSLGAASKSSGAGGGDCGIAIIGPDGDARAIRSAWRAKGIEPLDLEIYPPIASDPHEDSGSSRKDDHLRLALDFADSARNSFDDISIIHHSLHAIDVNDVSLSLDVCSRTWPAPFYINAMTGGSDTTGAINESLARAAQATGIAIASGSQHAALLDPSLETTFTTIREHTRGFVFANVGPTVTPEQAVRAVSMLHADALQIHLNAAQEIVMPEGNRAFDDWPQAIRRIVRASPVPVVVKEVGFGMSRETVDELTGLGVRMVDVSGRGGTDFAVIEHRRRNDEAYSYLDQWGQSTALSLLDVLHGPQPARIGVLASGGIRNPLDVLKSLALGARAVGVSGHFLRTLSRHGEKALAEEIDLWMIQLRSLMAVVGAPDVGALKRTDLLVSGRTGELARLRGIDVGALARRSSGMGRSGGINAR